MSHGKGWDEVGSNFGFPSEVTQLSESSTSYQGNTGIVGFNTKACHTQEMRLGAHLVHSGFKNP